MKTNNGLTIIKNRFKDNPEFQKAYQTEKTNYLIACKIRECRKREKLTQKQLAEKIGTQQSVISRLEKAEYSGHSLPILKKIAAALREPLHSFIQLQKGEEKIIKLEDESKKIFLPNPSILRKAASFTPKNNQIVKSNYAR